MSIYPILEFQASRRNIEIPLKRKEFQKQLQNETFFKEYKGVRLENGTRKCYRIVKNFTREEMDLYKMMHSQFEEKKEEVEENVVTFVTFQNQKGNKKGNTKNVVTPMVWGM